MNYSSFICIFIPLSSFIYAGESCVDPSRQCLQESICNGTSCVCPESMVKYGLYCLPENGVNHGAHDFQLSFQVRYT